MTESNNPYTTLIDDLRLKGMGPDETVPAFVDRLIEERDEKAEAYNNQLCAGITRIANHLKCPVDTGLIYEEIKSRVEKAEMARDNLLADRSRLTEAAEKAEAEVIRLRQAAPCAACKEDREKLLLENKQLHLGITDLAYLFDNVPSNTDCIGEAVKELYADRNVCCNERDNANVLVCSYTERHAELAVEIDRLKQENDALRVNGRIIAEQRDAEARRANGAREQLDAEHRVCLERLAVIDQLRADAAPHNHHALDALRVRVEQAEAYALKEQEKLARFHEELGIKATESHGDALNVLKVWSGSMEMLREIDNYIRSRLSCAGDRNIPSCTLDAVKYEVARLESYINIDERAMSHNWSVRITPGQTEVRDWKVRAEKAEQSLDDFKSALTGEGQELRRVKDAYFTLANAVLAEPSLSYSSLDHAFVNAVARTLKHDVNGLKARLVQACHIVGLNGPDNGGLDDGVSLAKKMISINAETSDLRSKNLRLVEDVRKVTGQDKHWITEYWDMVRQRDGWKNTAEVSAEAMTRYEALARSVGWSKEVNETPWSFLETEMGKLTRLNKSLSQARENEASMAETLATVTKEREDLKKRDIGPAIRISDIHRPLHFWIDNGYEDEAAQHLAHAVLYLVDAQCTKKG